MRMFAPVSRLTTRLDSVVDWFLPASLAADKVMRKQARLFLISHLCGPFIGNTVPLALYIFDPTPSWDIAVLCASITGFWIFPFVLKAIGHYSTLALISIQNLIFCILWSCYFYGGVTSPTLPWVLTIPLLSFFYIGESRRLRQAVLAMFAANVVVFGLCSYLLKAPLHDIPEQALQGLGIVSTIAAACYVLMMALYYARALASQAELEILMRHQRATMQDLRIAAAEAERASKAKAEFLAKMSHELRTPLNAVIGYSEMLLEEAEDTGDDEDVPDLQRINTAGVHLLRLVNNVLDLSKIEAGHMELFLEDFPFAGIVNAAVADLGEQPQVNGNTINVTIDPALGMMRNDQQKVQRVVSNVIQNANKYTQNGRIDIVCTRVDNGRSGMAQVEVRDTGIGIEPRYLHVIFEQFAVVDEQTSTKYGGTGVGLALTRELCRMMGGSISAASEPGKGSTFTLLLPLAAENGKPAPAALREVLALERAMFPSAMTFQAAARATEKAAAHA